MSTLTFFTVTGTFVAALKDSVYDVDTDPELTPMSGTVTFTPLIDSGDSLPAATLTPASNLFLVPVKATIRSGVITCNGGTGVKLVANTAVLGLTGNLYYRVDFGDGLTAGGKTYSVRTYDFQAPTSATTVDLVEVTPVAGQPATGPVPSSAVLSVAGRTGNIVVVANDINNASTIGKSLLTAADQAAVQAIVGAGGLADGSVTFPKLDAAAVVTAAETIAANNNDTTIPTSAAVQAAVTLAVNNLLNGAPGALNTLKELADAINDDASFAATITTALAGKQPLDSDLTTLAGLTATTDSFIQSKAGAWAARTVAQVKTDLGLSGTNSGDAPIDATTHAATGKTTPVDADELPIVDSAASNVLKKLTWANAKATLKTYFDTLYQPVTAKLTALAAQTWAADTLTYQTSTSALATTPLTAAGRALVDDADAAAQRTTLSAAKRITYLVDDYGADPTGVASSQTAVAAARTAMGTSRGVLQFGPGIYNLTAPVTEFTHHQGVEGAGKGATRIMYSGTGDLFRARDTRAYTDIFAALNDTAGAGIGFRCTGLTVDGTSSGATSSALHVGDMNAIVLDLAVVNFTNTGGKGVWLDNTATWTEQARVWISAANCTQGVVFDCNGGFPSYDYSTFWIQVQPRANQDGVVLKGSIELAGCQFTLVGGSDIHGSATNSGTILSIGATGGDTSNLNGCDILVAMEMSQVATGQPFEAHVPLLIGTNASIFNSRGSIRYFKRSAGNIQWKASSTGSGARIANFFGPVEGCSDVSEGIIAKFGSLQDPNGATILDLAGTASAVNFLGIGNHSTGNSPYMYAAGANTNIGMAFKPKGSGTFTLWDGNFNTVFTTAAGVASAVNYLYAGNAATGNKPSLGAAGSDTNVGLDLQTQGAGLVTANTLPVDAEQFITLTSTYTLTSQTAAQKLFNASTNGRVTLPIGTYFFECFFDLSSMSASSGGFGWDLTAGTATISGIKWRSDANKAALATAAAAQQTVNTAANTAIVTATTNTVGWAKITGKVRISAAGTVIPQVSLGVAAAAVVGVDSYFRIWNVGLNTVTTAGTWS